MDPTAIARVLSFHGQGLQKIWEDECGADFLQKCGVPQKLDFSVFQERQKHFAFQDRTKRLNLHQFIVRKAADFYSKNLVKTEKETTKTNIDNGTLQKIQEQYVVMPPYEIFKSKTDEKIQRSHSLLHSIKPGDLIYGMVTKASNANSASLNISIKPLCTAEPHVRYLGHSFIKTSINPAHFGTLPLNENGKPRFFCVNDFVCCEVLDISVDTDRLTLGMEGNKNDNRKIQLGLITNDELPKYYRQMEVMNPSDNYEEFLTNSKEFRNPNYEVLFKLNNLESHDTFSFLNAFKNPIPMKEHFGELRREQAGRWAFRSVAEGIERFKMGQHVEAFQCLNRALTMDPGNVEGLVARGALYANKGKFAKAVDDFQEALKKNAYHQNARKYLGETLVALGHSYEEDRRYEDARKAYMECLSCIPNHEQARLSLDLMNQSLDNIVQRNVSYDQSPGTSAMIGSHSKEGSSNSIKSNIGSSDSESSSDETNDTYSSRSRSSKKSLSPLSQRMKLHAAANQPSQPKCDPTMPYYMAQQQFDEDDTRSRIKKLFHEASKHKKQKSKKRKSSKHKEDDDKFIEKKYEELGKTLDKEQIIENIEKCDKSLAAIKRRQEEIIKQATEGSRQDTPPPKPPSMSLSHNATSEPSTSQKSLQNSSAIKNHPKLSFQIKKPIKIEKSNISMVADQSPMKSKSSNSPTHRQRSSRHSHSSLSRSPRSRSTTRSGSRSRTTRSRCYSRSSSRTRSSTRSRSGSSSYRRRQNRPRRPRRSNSPPTNSLSPTRSKYSNNIKTRRMSTYRGRSSYDFQGRRTSPLTYGSRRPTPPSRSRRSRSPLVGSGSRFSTKPREYSRPWKRGDFTSSNTKPNQRKTGDDILFDDPSIEEIDEMISRAQKERKQEIINRDKDILKKPSIGNNC